MNVKAIRSYGIYKKIMNAPFEKKNHIYHYEMMMPFEKKWACYNVPMKASTLNGYDVLMVSAMLGHIVPTILDETQKTNIELISSNSLWSECEQSVKQSLNCFVENGIDLPVQEYQFTILLANTESPYVKMNEGYVEYQDIFSRDFYKTNLPCSIFLLPLPTKPIIMYASNLLNGEMILL